MAQEHLWSAWIGRLFPKQVVTWKIVDPETFGVKSGQMESLDLKVEAVCSNCNSGWMSKLESSVQPILSPVIKDGESMYFAKRDINKLAAFTFKNAVIANCLNPAREPFFTRAARERFRETRHIPTSVSCWLAGLSTPILTGLNFGYVLGLQTRYENGVWDDLEIYVYTFAIGYLVLQLRAFRFADMMHRGRTLPRSLPQNPFWDHYSIPFWPNSASMLRWPPAEHLSEDFLSKYTGRWAGPIRVWR